MDLALQILGLILVFLVSLIGGYLLMPGCQALRRRLTERWLRKRLESYEAEDKEWASEPKPPAPEGATWWGYDDKGRPHWEPEASCPTCYPQPTSQQPSAPTTGITMRHSEWPGVSHAGEPEQSVPPETTESSK